MNMECEQQCARHLILLFTEMLEVGYYYRHFTKRSMFREVNYLDGVQ